MPLDFWLFFRLTAGVILALLRFEKGVVHAMVPCHTLVSLASMGRWRLEP